MATDADCWIALAEGGLETTFHEITLVNVKGMMIKT
jgi:hypothetical protein